MGGRSATPAPLRARCLLVFTKPAVPGRVKTRLIGHLSAAAAARLHQALLDDLLEALAGGRFTVRLALALEANEPVPPIRHPVIAGIERQRGSDLGQRMLHALAAAGSENDRVAVVGSDLPGLDARGVDDAFDRLDRGDDVVLGPTADGGYYLLAVRAERIDARLFAGVEWSTGRVLEQTLERCDALGLRRSLLAPGRDIDHPADLDWLAESLHAGRLLSPRVAAWLRRRQTGDRASARRSA
jgi:rSAM/selenodomain-associated transferase 1